MIKRDVKIGALLSYLLIIFNAAYGLVISPYMLSTIGESSYGVYKTIGSLSASLMILDLGIGGTMQRFLAKYNAEGKREEINSFAGMGIVLATILNGIVLLISVGLYFSLDRVYGVSFSPYELRVAKIVFLISILNLVLHVFENVIQGMISGCNRFSFLNGVKVGALALRMAVIYVILPLWPSAVAIMSLTVAIELILIVVELSFVFKKLHIRFCFRHMDKSVFFESSKYTAMMFVQSLTVQFNSNLDNVIVGSILGSVAVAVYSFGLTVFNMFQQLSTAISGVMLPTVTDAIAKGTDNKGIENLVIRVGRVQFLLLGAALCGFALIGKDFILLWLGEDYLDVCIITLILMIPAIWELSQNVCLSVLRAKNLLGFRSVSLIVGMVFNIIISWFGTKLFGYYAAAFGTAISIVVGSLIMMNIYYYKKLKINVIRIFSQIISYAAPGLMIASAGLIGLNLLIPAVSWLWIAVKGLAFVLMLGLFILVKERIRKSRPV